MEKEDLSPLWATIKQAGLTQTEVARLVKVGSWGTLPSGQKVHNGRITVSRWMTGKTYPSRLVMPVLKALVARLDAALDKGLLPLSAELSGKDRETALMAALKK